METVLEREGITPSKKKKVIGIIILILFALVSGILFGMLYVNFAYASTTDFSGYSEVGLRDNENEIMSKFGSSPVGSLNGVNAFIIAENKLAEHSHITMQAEGSINAAGVKQTMYTTRYKNDAAYYVENISKGKVVMGIDTNIAERDYYDEASKTVKVYKGTNIQDTSATFKELTEQISLDEWKEKNGTTPISFQPYIVSTKTINDASKPTNCTLENGKQGFSFKISLAASGAFLYVKQIKNLSGLGDYPSFLKIHLEVFLNEDGTFNKIVVDERYKVKKGIWVETVSEMIYRFNYTSTEIPQI